MPDETPDSAPAKPAKAPKTPKAKDGYVVMRAPDSLTMLSYDGEQCVAENGFIQIPVAGSADALAHGCSYASGLAVAD